MSAATDRDVIVIGGGLAGLSAAIFIARHDLSTLVIDAGESLIRRNAHLENFPGFPTGVNARHLLDLLQEQLKRSGAERRTDRVTKLDHGADTFTVETASGDRVTSASVIAATKNEVGYLEHIDDLALVDRGKLFVSTDEHGRTDVDGLYAAGRMAEKPHQAIVAAGHGAEVAVTVLEDIEQPFYHDWVAPDGYFTDRDRELPPGCEEIPSDEQDRRESASLAYMQDAFAEPHPDEQETHPSLVD